MVRKPHSRLQQRRLGGNPDAGVRPQRRPFWLPAGSYYLLAVAITIAAFFLVWWVLSDANGGTPWIPAGIISSVLLIISVWLREVVLKKARMRYLAASRRLDSNLSSVGQGTKRSQKGKLTREQNAIILDEIERKSKAARTLREVPDVHLEVFEVCEEYLKLTASELTNIAISSPRLGSLRRGRRRVKELHRYHLLTWAAVESGVYTREAQICDTIDAKIENAEKALDVLNSAIHFYPNEKKLTESAEVVKEIIASSQISDKIAKAEKATKTKDYGFAINSYKDALYFLARREERSAEMDKIAEDINSRIEGLRRQAEDSTQMKNYKPDDLEDRKQ